MNSRAHLMYRLPEITLAKQTYIKSAQPKNTRDTYLDKAAS